MNHLKHSVPYPPCTPQTGPCIPLNLMPYTVCPALYAKHFMPPTNTAMHNAQTQTQTYTPPDHHASHADSDSDIHAP